MTDEVDDGAVVSGAPPKKITIDEMIAEVIDHLGFLERDVYFAEQDPDKCDVPKKKRRLAAFMQILQTLELVELHEAGFVNLIKAAKPSRRTK